jgi:hypothetical protein
MSSDFGRNYLMKLAGMGTQDSETRLIVPGKITRTFTLNYFAALPGLASGTKSNVFKDILERIVTSGFLSLSVTDVMVRGEHVMPKSKGIGSIGEIIHVMGAKNENITLNFTTDKFPGVFSGALKYLIQAMLQNADVIYVVDDLLVASACLLRTYELKKVGRLKSAVVGTLVLEVLPTETFGLGGQTASTLLIVRNALAANAINNILSEIPVWGRWMTDYFVNK